VGGGGGGGPVGGGGGGGVASPGTLTVTLTSATLGDVVAPDTGEGTVPVAAVPVLVVDALLLLFDELPMKKARANAASPAATPITMMRTVVLISGGPIVVAFDLFEQQE
jgi:hypothetical protein